MVQAPLRAFRISRVAAAVLVLVALSSAPYVQLSQRVAHDGFERTGWPYTFTYFGAAFVSVALFGLDVVPRLRDCRLWSRLLPLICFGGWAMASAGWSARPAVTPSQAILMTSFLTYSVWFGAALAPKEQAAALVGATQALILASFVGALLFPSHAMVLGSWIGVFASRNTLGPTAAFGLLLLGLCGLTCWVAIPNATRVGGAIVAVVDAIVVVKASSSTSVVAFAAAVVAPTIVIMTVKVWRGRGWSGYSYVAAGALILPAGWLVSFTVVDRVAKSLGRDATFSDRRLIWAYLRDQIAERPIAGFGYGAFWEDAGRVFPLYEITGSVYDSAHSSFIETWLWLGAVGLALILVVSGQSALVACRGVWNTSDSRIAVAAVSILAFVLVENLSESMIALHSIFWVLLVAIAFFDPQRPLTQPPIDTTLRTARLPGPS